MNLHTTNHSWQRCCPHDSLLTTPSVSPANLPSASQPIAWRPTRQPASLPACCNHCLQQPCAPMKYPGWQAGETTKSGPPLLEARCQVLGISSRWHGKKEWGRAALPLRWLSSCPVHMCWGKASLAMGWPVLKLAALEPGWLKAAARADRRESAAVRRRRVGHPAATSPKSGAQGHQETRTVARPAGLATAVSCSPLHSPDPIPTAGDTKNRALPPPHPPHTHPPPLQN